MRPLSTYSIPSFPYIHPVAAYVFFLVFRHFYPSVYLSFNNVFQKAVTMQDVTNMLRFPSFLCTQDIPLLLDSLLLLISHTIGPNDLLHPSPAPHFKAFQLFLII